MALTCQHMGIFAVSWSLIGTPYRVHCINPSWWWWWWCEVIIAKSSSPSWTQPNLQFAVGHQPKLVKGPLTTISTSTQQSSWIQVDTQVGSLVQGNSFPSRDNVGIKEQQVTFRQRVPLSCWRSILACFIHAGLMVSEQLTKVFAACTVQRRMIIYSNYVSILMIFLTKCKTSPRDLM